MSTKLSIMENLTLFDTNANSVLMYGCEPWRELSSKMATSNFKSATVGTHQSMPFEIRIKEMKCKEVGYT